MNLMINGRTIQKKDLKDWLDKHFVLFELINPEFTYAQIKLKFGMARVYLQGLPSTCAQIAEDAINKIMKCEL